MALQAPSGPRGAIVEAIRQRLLKATPAADRVYLNRTEPIRTTPGVAELPALVVHEMSEGAQNRSKAPRAYTRTLRIGVAVHVPRQAYTAGQMAMGQNLGPSETQRRAELCKAVEDALLSDPRLEADSGGTALTGDCEYAGTQFAQEAKVDVALASALVLFDYTYVTEHKHGPAILAGPLDKVHVDYEEGSAQSNATAADDIQALSQ